MLDAASVTSATLQPYTQGQAHAIQTLTEADPEVASAVQAAQTATQWQVALVKQLMTFDGNSVSQLLAPLDPSLGQTVDFRV